MPRLTFRSVSAGMLGDFFDAAYPAWVRALRGKSGVYLIRSNAGALLYVGESHTGRLYETLTRHFQSWSGPTAGNTYGRGAVKVAAIVTPAGKAVARQNRLICEMQPRDNSLAPDCETQSDNPF